MTKTSAVKAEEFSVSFALSSLPTTTAALGVITAATEEPTNSKSTILVNALTVVGCVPALMVTDCKPEYKVPAKTTGLTVVVLFVIVRFSTPFIVNKGAAEAASAPVTDTLNESAPAPPIKLSPGVNVPVVASVRMPEKTSAPAAPVNLEPVSKPVVRVNAPLTIATASEVAKEPLLVPVVCDKTNEASTLALNEVAYVPYVTSAVICE